MSRESRVKWLVTVLALLTACGSVPPPADPGVGVASQAQNEDYGAPDPRPVAVWEEQLRALKCNYYGHSVSIRSREPLIFAMMAVCLGGHLARMQPEMGYRSILVVDTGRNEVQSTRIKANGGGGLHYTATGDLIWFATDTRGTSQRDQHFVEAFTAPAGTVAESSLGKLAIPFAANPPAVHVGEDCHVLQVSAFRGKSEDPRLQMMWVFRDEDPMASAKPVEGVGRILYWNPIGRYFVTQKQAYLDGGPQRVDTRERAGLTCSGESFPLQGQDTERLARVTYVGASYLPLPNGDLVVASESEAPDKKGAGELLVFRGERMDRIGPFSLPDRDCPDFSCAPIGFNAFLHGASATGRHFLAEVSLVNIFTVYRVDDLAKVRRWRTREFSDRYVHVLIDDTTVMQLENTGGPISYYEIPGSRAARPLQQ